MENCKRIEAELQQLPEEIIQHIQSFLNAKESASTAILSKSWYNAWLTHPNLDFDQLEFQRHSCPTYKSVDRFLNIVDKTLERYRKMNLFLQSFRLYCLDVSNVIPYSPSTDELILKALKLGANTVSLNLLKHPLPKELFRTESLLDLSVYDCGIPNAEVMCRRLKSLSLSYLCIEDDMINEIMSECPLIENLCLSRCEGLVKVNVSKLAKLKRFSVITHCYIGVLRARKILIEIDQHCKFLNLTYLLFERVKIDETLFSDFSKKFPCIQDFIVKYCEGFVRFDISSRSLKTITLDDDKRLEIHLDVPNIRITFSGSTVPTPWLITASREWELDIHLDCYIRDFNASEWFELNRCLTNSQMSKTSLSLFLFSRCEEYNNCVMDIQVLPKPMVENIELMVRMDSKWPRLLDGVFWSLRPKIISLLIVFEPRVEAAKYVLLLLRKKLKGVEISKELVEVTAEYFDNNTKQWMAKRWNTLVHALRREMIENGIRLRLKWRHTYNA